MHFTKLEKINQHSKNWMKLQKKIVWKFYIVKEQYIMTLRNINNPFYIFRKL